MIFGERIGFQEMMGMFFLGGFILYCIIGMIEAIWEEWKDSQKKPKEEWTWVTTVIIIVLFIACMELLEQYG